MSDEALPFGLRPDERMKYFIGGFDLQGRPIPITPATLRARTGVWPTSTGTPAEIALLLKTSRDLFTFSYFAYEFLTIGVLVSLQAVEASLRHRLQAKGSLARLIPRALELDVITADEADRLDAGRKLRNDFSHPSGGIAYTYGMTAPLIESSHALVAKLFD